MRLWRRSRKAPAATADVPKKKPIGGVSGMMAMTEDPESWPSGPRFEHGRKAAAEAAAKDKQSLGGA